MSDQRRRGEHIRRCPRACVELQLIEVLNVKTSSYQARAVEARATNAAKVQMCTAHRFGFRAAMGPQEVINGTFLLQPPNVTEGHYCTLCTSAPAPSDTPPPIPTLPLPLLARPTAHSFRAVLVLVTRSVVGACSSRPHATPWRFIIAAASCADGLPFFCCADRRQSHLFTAAAWEP